MKTTFKCAIACILGCCMLLSSISLSATDTKIEELIIDKSTSSYDEAPCKVEILIGKIDCDFIMLQQGSCVYSTSYTVLYASTYNGEYAPIGTYKKDDWYNIKKNGCYKLKTTCGYACYESNVLCVTSCGETVSSHCDLDLHCPYPQYYDYCYDSKGKLTVDAGPWVKGCGRMTYKWDTPYGVINDSWFSGHYGYGKYTLTVTCHDYGYCNYKQKSVSFTLVDKCQTSSCHYSVDCPIASTVINHCYGTEGNVKLDAAQWVSGCSKVQYSWKTPKTIVNKSKLDGNYGYGQYKLTITCSDYHCHHKKTEVWFVLKDACPSFHLYCPEDVWVDCEEELWDLDYYGNPYYIHNGHKVWVKNEKVRRHLNDCNRGYITREWKVADSYGGWHKCTQKIYVGENAYGKPNIKWPKEEVKLEGCNPSLKPMDMPDGAQEPHYDDGGCSRYGHSYTDQVFYFNSTCKKVVRKWVVYDWCTYTPNTQSSHGSYTYYQKIIINNADEPVVDIPADVTVASQNCEKGKVEIDDFKVAAGSCGNKFVIKHDSYYADKQGDNASGDYPVGKTKVTYTVHYGCGYSKEYIQYITVENNVAPVPYCIAKTVAVLMAVDTDGDGIVDNGMVEVWAKDFDLGAEDRCDDAIYFSFSADEMEMSRAFTCDDVGANELKIYVSNSSGQQAYCSVTLDVQNNSANIPNCEAGEGDANDNNRDEGDEVIEEEEEEEEEVTEEHEDEDEFEEENEETESNLMANITGGIKLHYGESMPDIKVMLHTFVMDTILEVNEVKHITETKIDSFYNRSGALLFITRKDTVITTATNFQISEQMMEQQTSGEGDYLFQSVLMHAPYEVEPLSLDLSDNHVDFGDVSRLYQHLTGENEFSTAYEYLAGDVDGSGHVNFDDLSLLFDYLDGKADVDFEADWMIVDASYNFLSDEQAMNEPYPTTHKIPNLDQEEYYADFILIQSGDVTGEQAEDEELVMTTLRERLQINIVARPNPFSELTSLTIRSPKTQEAELLVYTISGEKIYQSKERLSKGMNSFRLSSKELPHSGVYIYNVVLGDQILKGRLLKIK